jgi:hypothetical protein
MRLRSPALRWTLFALMTVALAGSAYLIWTARSQSHSLIAAADDFDRRAGSAGSSILELRMAQQAYVAAGQGDEFWGSKVATQMAALREELTAIRGMASTDEARTELDEALAALGDFERMDARAREYTRGNQRLLASDLIFSDGLEKTTTMASALDAARGLERDNARRIAAASRQRELLLAAGGAAAAIIVTLLLVPSVRGPAAAAPAPAAGMLDLSSPPAASASTASPISETPIHGLSFRDARDPMPPLPTVTPPSMREAETDALDPLDLGKVASLCTELARVVDTRALPGVLERTASVLDANGVVLWIADPDGRELNPIVTHGYPPQLVTRLGTIPRDAQNATAAAFRTSLLQTVDADAVSNGAIAVPLVTPAGCVGVMAAEVRHGGEKQDAKLAAAAIVAAQLATLVGPPSSRPQSRAEVAG